MKMDTNSLRDRIDNALRLTQFTDVYRGPLEASSVRQLYTANHRISLTSTDAIRVCQAELRPLASELEADLGRYRSPSGSVGNGLYLLQGSSGSPRLPSIEDYAKVLVLAAARIGSERVSALFAGWLEGKPILGRHCALFKGVTTDGVLEPFEGMRIETPPLNVDDLDTSLRVDDHGIRPEPFEKQAMLVIEYETICPLYEPESFRESFPPDPLPWTLVNSTLPSASFNDICRAISLETNHFVVWSKHWKDFGDVEAFFLQSSPSGLVYDSRSPAASRVISAEGVRSALRTHKNWIKCSSLKLPTTRWLRSKRSLSPYEQLIELRIALEALLLPGDRQGEKGFRLAVRGAWLLGENFENRKTIFDVLRDVYDSASNVIHGGEPKKQGQDLEEMIREAQDLCRTAIQRFAVKGNLPKRCDWRDMILGEEQISSDSRP